MNSRLPLPSVAKTSNGHCERLVELTFVAERTQKRSVASSVDRGEGWVKQSRVRRWLLQFHHRLLIDGLRKCLFLSNQFDDQFHGQDEF